MTRTRDRSLVAVLSAAVADPTTAGALVRGHLATHGWTSLAESAAGHGVAARTWEAVQVAGADDQDGAVRLAHEVRTSALRAVRAHADLRTAGDALAAVGIAPTVVKGPALADVVYRRRGQRSYDDLDLVVRPDELGAALSALEAAGAHRLDANWPEMARRLVGQVRFRMPSGGVLDLHWHLLNDVRLREAFDLDRGRWESRLVPVHLGGVAVTVMDPVATLVHVAVHTATSGGHRLVWHQDLAELLLRPDLDVGAVVAMSEETGTALALATMVARTQRLLGKPIPTELLAALRRAPGWRAAAALADRLSPPRPSTGIGSASQLLARSLRGSASSSRREFVARVAAFARQGSHHALLSADRLFDASDPISMSYPAGDGAAREAFLRAVEA